MAAADVTYARARSARARNAKAAKAKRQKLMLVGGGLLFVLLVVVQVPRTLKMLNPPAESVPVAAEIAPAVPPVVGAPAEAEAGRWSAERLRQLLGQFTAKDPFAHRSAIRAGAGVPIRPAAPGETDPFEPRSSIVASDGPIAGLSAPTPVAEAAPPAAEPTPTPAAAAPAAKGPTGFTIVLASIPVHSGRLAAIGTAAGARERGIGGVGVLRSSDYPLLRPGYHVVHSKIFKTRREAERALSYARANGYRTAYIRRLG